MGIHGRKIARGGIIAAVLGIIALFSQAYKAFGNYAVNENRITALEVLTQKQETKFQVLGTDIGIIKQDISSIKTDVSRIVKALK